VWAAIRGTTEFLVPSSGERRAAPPRDVRGAVRAAAALILPKATQLMRAAVCLFTPPNAEHVVVTFYHHHECSCWADFQILQFSDSRLVGRRPAAAEDAFAMFDDDNDLPMAAAVGHGLVVRPPARSPTHSNRSAPTAMESKETVTPLFAFF